MKFRVTLTASTKHADMPASQIASWLGHFAEYSPTVEVKPYYVNASACIDAPRDELLPAIERITDQLKATFGARPLSITTHWRTDV